MDNSERQITIAYQGVPGSYSHQCVSRTYPQAAVEGHNTFEGAIEAVKSDAATYALLPVENSIAGRVTDMHHLLANSGLHIRAEHYHAVRHCLLGKSGAKLTDIKRAYSHPMALAQCRNFLHEHAIAVVPFSDTAEAARHISKQDTLEQAAIASENAATLHNLTILARDIQDITDNTTRFFLVGREPLAMARDAQVTTAIFYTVQNIPAALFKSLSGFATCGVNVTKLESFMPMRGNGSARFYIEFDGHPEAPGPKQALTELSHYAEHVTLIGTFAKG